jgi:8-hydroxy-5-deazaflavin:NADPH oxidoreductase
MRIGIIGVGHIGGTLAAHFVRVGHDVILSNSRGPETLEPRVAELGEHATAATPAEAARVSDLVVVSIPFGRFRELPAREIGRRIVIDTNNYYAQRDGSFEELDGSAKTSSELLQTYLAEARVVKAFNSIQWEHLRDDGRPAGDPERIGLPIAGDDPEAKHVVARLIDQIGFDAVDAGGLGEGGRLYQPGTAIYGANLRTDELRAELSG